MGIVRRLKLRAVSGIRWCLARGIFRSRRFRYAPATGREARVLMCLWNRPSRIHDILTLLDGQEHPDGVELYLWNNNRSDHAAYLQALAEARPASALHAVHYVKSPLNLGSIARFYWAKRLGNQGYAGSIVVLDDDEDVTPGFLNECVRQYEPRIVKAWWAFRVEESYWHRTPAQVGDPVDHVGPGGMVCNVELFRDPAFFDDIPERFRLLDDIWLSYYAPQHGYTLAKLDVDIRFVMDDTNQFHGQSDIKPEFYAHLRLPLHVDP